MIIIQREGVSRKIHLVRCGDSRVTPEIMTLEFSGIPEMTICHGIGPRLVTNGMMCYWTDALRIPGDF
jgi:hypothetical protein